MTVLQFESKNIRDFRKFIINSRPDSLENMKHHYLKKVAKLNDYLRSSREKALSELTYRQFVKYQSYHLYLDCMTYNQIETITKRKATMRAVERSRELFKRITEVNALIKVLRQEIEYKEVA